MKYKILGLLASVAIFLGSTLIISSVHASGGPEVRAGVVASKGIVKDRNGSRIWVEYNTLGNVTREIGSAIMNLKDARVMAPDEYRALYPNQPADIPDDIRSVLVRSDGVIITKSKVNIGYFTAFYTPEESLSDPTSATEGVNSAIGYNRWSDDKLWGPILGAGMSTALGGGYTSKEDGTYFIYYILPSCPGFSYNYSNPIFAALTYQRFNPRINLWGRYPVFMENRASCFGFSEGFFGFSLTGLAVKALITGIEAGMATYHGTNNFSIDMAFVAGEAVLKSDSDDLTIPLGSSTKYSYDSSDNEQGLLETISMSDLENTDLYIFRVSNGQLVASREGLNGIEISTGNEPDRLLNYQMIMRGPAINNAYDIGSFARDHERYNINDELRARNSDHLRVGEQIKVVMVNRATGYIGTSIAEYGSGLYRASITVNPKKIEMYPPNLKINVERQYKVEHGLTTEEERKNIIGFEGSGLTSDQFLKMTVEWYDRDGTPLPENLPGYTGRIAKVVAPNELAPAQGQISNFRIKPGSHTYLVLLPTKEIDNEHYYIHVSGEPIERIPSFTTLGAGAGPLQYRPKNFVPIKVPFFVGPTTPVATFLDKDDKIYSWLYYPEMQFSLFDLEIKEINRVFEDEEGVLQTVNMLEDYTQAPSASDLWLDILYDLLKPDQDPLDPFGEPRQFVFAVGDQKLDVTIGANGEITFFEPEKIKQLSSEDYLVMKLYQESDHGNILWEFAYLAVDLEIYKPRVLDDPLPSPSEPMIPDEVELSKGSITYVNLDNDDINDSKFDISDDEVTGGDDELVKIKLKLYPKDLSSGKVKLTATAGAGSIKVWKQNDKATASAYDLVNDELSVPADFKPDVGGNFLYKEMWVEGINAHTSQRQTKLKMTYERDGSEKAKDEVALTVIGIDKIEWIGRRNSLNGSNSLTNDPNNSGNAVRVFPGAWPVFGSVGPARDKVDVDVKLSVSSPYDFKLYFKSFDIDDPSSDGTVDPNDSGGSGNYSSGGRTYTAEEDNRGSVSGHKAGKITGEDSSQVKKLLFEANISQKTFEFQTTKQPGDNFVIVGNGDRDFILKLRNNDKDDGNKIVNFDPSTGTGMEILEPNKYSTQKILTVWRFLHVERDSMGPPGTGEIFDGAGVGNDDVNPGNLGNSDISLMQTLYRTVYVEVVDDLAVSDSKDELAFRHNMAHANAAAEGNSVRDVNSQDFFWVIQVLSAYEGPNTSDNDPNSEPAIMGFAPGPCMIYNESIRDVSLNRAGAVNSATLERRIVAHETVHRFNFLGHAGGLIMDANTNVFGAGAQNVFSNNQMDHIRSQTRTTP